MSIRPTRSIAAAATLAALLGTAAPAHADKLAVTGITVELPGGPRAVLSVPSVSVVDGTLDEAKIRSLFASGPGVVATDLAALDASLVTIPVLTVSDPQLAYPLVVVRNVVLQDVKAGRAGIASIGSISIAVDDKTQFDLDAMTAEGLNIKTLLGLWGLVAVADRTTLQPVYDTFSFDGLKFASAEANCTFDMMHLGALVARPLRPGTVAALASNAGRQGQNMSPREAVTFVQMYADLLTAYRLGTSMVMGMACDVTEPQPARLSLGGITQLEAPPNITPEVSYTDLSFERPDGKVTIGDFTLKQIDFTGPLAAVEAQGAALTPQWLIQNYRKLIPAIAGFTTSDVVADVPDESRPGARNQVSYDVLDVALADYVNGIPTRIGALLDKLHVDLADTPENQQLFALGYRSIDLTSALDLHWDKDANTIVVDGVALNWANAGSVRLTGVVGNATPDLFADNPPLAMRAAQGLTLKSATLELTDAGILAKGIGIAAAEQNIEPAAFRAAIGAMIQGTIIIGLGGAPEAMPVARAMMDFVNGTAPHLTVTATAIDPNGISLADLEATRNDPKALLPKLRLTASTEAAQPPAPPTQAPAPDAMPPALPSAGGGEKNPAPSAGQ